MKFNKLANKIIAEMRDDDNIQVNPDDFEYTWENIELKDPVLLFDVSMVGKWNYFPGENGDYLTPATNDEYEFVKGEQITNVIVYNDDTNEKETLTAEEFKNKYPEDYMIFMDKYFNAEPEEHPVGEHYSQSYAGRGKF